MVSAVASAAGGVLPPTPGFVTYIVLAVSLLGFAALVVWAQQSKNKN